MTPRYDIRFFSAARLPRRASISRRWPQRASARIGIGLYRVGISCIGHAFCRAVEAPSTLLAAAKLLRDSTWQPSLARIGRGIATRRPVKTSQVADLSARDLLPRRRHGRRFINCRHELE